MGVRRFRVSSFSFQEQKQRRKRAKANAKATEGSRGGRPYQNRVTLLKGYGIDLYLAILG
jgi:hypothetical protein